MSRTAQDVLEFDKLRELLRLRTTCAPGRRAVDALEPGMDRAALETAFAHIREAREWLRAITAFPRLPELLRTMRQLQKRVEQLESQGSTPGSLNE